MPWPAARAGHLARRLCGPDRRSTIMTAITERMIAFILALALTGTTLDAILV